MLTKKRERLVNEIFRRKNLKQRKYDYEINLKVLKKLHKSTKLGENMKDRMKLNKSMYMAI